MKVYAGTLNTFAKRGVLLNIVEETVTIVRDTSIYANCATVEMLTAFGGIIDEEPYDDTDFDPDEYDNYFESYDEYYNTCHKIGYIPAGTIVTICGSGVGLELIRNGVQIFAPSSDYEMYEVTPTKNGKIYFDYVKDHAHMPFDTAIQAIKDAGKIFGIDYDIGYTTQQEKIAERVKAIRANKTI